MPRLRDVRLAVREVGFKRLALNVYNQVSEDSVLVWASSLAYSWLFAMFPFVIFLLTLLPYMPAQQKEQVLAGIDTFLQQLPTESASQLRPVLDDAVTNVLTQTRGGLMSIGLLLALWAASGGMSATMSALDRCYDIDVGRAFYHHRGLAMFLTIIVATLMLIVVAVLPIGGLVLNWLWTNSQALIGYQLPPALKIVLDIARWVIGMLLLMIVLNVVYHFGCQVRRRYRFFTPGAMFCILMWVLIGVGFREYVDRVAYRSYNATYGTVGGVVILMFLFYLAAIVLLVGAELNSEIDYAIHKVPRGTKDFRKLETALARRSRTSSEQPEA